MSENRTVVGKRNISIILLLLAHFSCSELYPVYVEPVVTISSDLRVFDNPFHVYWEAGKERYQIVPQDSLRFLIDIQNCYEEVLSDEYYIYGTIYCSIPGYNEAVKTLDFTIFRPGVTLTLYNDKPFSIPVYWGFDFDDELFIWDRFPMDEMTPFPKTIKIEAYAEVGIYKSLGKISTEKIEYDIEIKPR